MASRATSTSVPSTYRARSDNPQKKVDDLVRKYQRPNDPSPVMLEILNNPDIYSILVAALRRHVSLVKCRSQDFEDCQVTVYDRALLNLSKQGDSATDPGALELYLMEFLGVVPIAPIEDGKDTVLKHIRLQDALERAHEKRPAAPSKEHKPEQEESSSFDIHNEYEHYFPSSTTAKERELNVRVVRLLDVYRQAKDDYFSTKERDGVDSLIAVRFLRDSAENTLRYLRTNGLLKHPWVPDLEQTFALARDKTAQILGGRKRHFDEERQRERENKYKRRARKRAHRTVDSYRPPHDSGY
ncbi:hypothetical protein BJX99DRAFT_256240 [Aspergillus californicus]